jgi:hypothetical protein
MDQKACRYSSGILLGRCQAPIRRPDLVQCRALSKPLRFNVDYESRRCPLRGRHSEVPGGRLSPDDGLDKRSPYKRVRLVTTQLPSGSQTLRLGARLGVRNVPGRQSGHHPNRRRKHRGDDLPAGRIQAQIDGFAQAPAKDWFTSCATTTPNQSPERPRPRKLGAKGCCVPFAVGGTLANLSAR